MFHVRKPYLNLDIEVFALEMLEHYNSVGKGNTYNVFNQSQLSNITHFEYSYAIHSVTIFKRHYLSNSNNEYKRRKLQSVCGY